MKKLWSIAILFSVVFAQLPEPTMVGQDKLQVPTLSEIGRAHVWTPVTRPDLVCRLLLEKKNKNEYVIWYETRNINA